MTDWHVGAFRMVSPTLRFASSWWPPWKSIEVIWRRNQDILASATSLVATTGVASVLGFAYWAIAARLFSQSAVGYGSAAVSAVTLLGTIGMLGLGTVLIAELPRRTRALGLISAALVASGAASLILGLVFAVAAPLFNDQFRHITGSLSQACLFIVGVVLTGITLVFDQATIGLQRGGLQLGRNTAFAGVKLVALPAIVLVLHDKFGSGVTLSWVAGMAISLLFVVIHTSSNGEPLFVRPDWAVLRRLGRTAVYHNWLNIAIQGPRLLIPVLVTLIVSPVANSAFYAAWTLVAFLYIIPTHLSTALFAAAAADPHSIAPKLRLTLRLSLLIGLPIMAALALGAHLALSMFGPSYASAATIPLILLAAGYLPNIPKLHYIAVCRATGHIPKAALVLTLAAALEIVAATAGGLSDGLVGLTLALLAAYILEGLLTSPTVLRAAFAGSGHPLLGNRRGRHRRIMSGASALGGTGEPVTRLDAPEREPHSVDHGFPPARASEPALDNADSVARQRAGIAALVSLAAGAISSDPYREVLTEPIPVIRIVAEDDSEVRWPRDRPRGSKAENAGRGQEGEAWFRRSTRR